METKQEIKEEVKEEEKKETVVMTNFQEVLAKADETAIRIEEANKEAQRILEQHQELTARQMLGGKSDNGEQEEVKKEVSPKDYAEKVMKGELNEKNEEGEA